jgi:hypothetical protein
MLLLPDAQDLSIPARPAPHNSVLPMAMPFTCFFDRSTAFASLLFLILGLVAPMLDFGGDAVSPIFMKTQEYQHDIRLILMLNFWSTWLLFCRLFKPFRP